MDVAVALTARMYGACGRSIKKSDAKQPKRVVVSLQATLRQLSQLDQGYLTVWTPSAWMIGSSPALCSLFLTRVHGVRFADCVVLHGGLGFQVVEDDRGVLSPLSQGCYFIERLACVRAVVRSSAGLA